MIVSNSSSPERNTIKGMATPKNAPAAIQVLRNERSSGSRKDFSPSICMTDEGPKR